MKFHKNLYIIKTSPKQCPQALTATVFILFLINPALGRRLRNIYKLPVICLCARFLSAQQEPGLNLFQASIQSLVVNRVFLAMVKKKKKKKCVDLIGWEK